MIPSEVTTPGTPNSEFTTEESAPGSGEENLDDVFG